MAVGKAKVIDQSSMTVEEKLSALFKLQQVDSKIDEISVLRGELPLEVQDLEDEIAGLETRIQNYQDDVKEFEQSVADKRNEIIEAQALIKKYKEQQNNVRNNREYDSLTKEIEYQTLEIELCEKRIREFTQQAQDKSAIIAESKSDLEGRMIDLNSKKSELDRIVKENEKDELKLSKESELLEEKIEERLLTAYKRIRGNARNGKAVVAVERDACGGCYNKIPPQRQLDICMRKKIIVCEYCGRILVDPAFGEE